MKNKIFLALLIGLYFFLNSCLNLQPCNKDIIGKYSCNNIDDAENYLEIKKDGTFYHYFKKDTVMLDNMGVWEWTKKGYCIIELKKWKSFNLDGLNYENYGNKFLHINRNYLDMGPDGESNTSFKKENNILK